MAKTKTNEAFIRKLMTQSKTGALMQAFILEGIYYYAMQQIKAFEEDPSYMCDHFISPQAWRKCADEVRGAVIDRTKGG